MAIVRIARPTVRSKTKMWRGRQIDLTKRGVELGDKWDDWRRRR
jgi:hypothetical protein